MRGTGRRRLLLTGAGAVVVAGVSAAAGRMLLSRRSAATARRAVRLPAPVSGSRPVPAGAQVRVPGMTPFRTPNRDFYRVDTALTPPQVDPREWMLRVHGLVQHPVELSFGELLRRPLTERDITLSCVSNEVGGTLAGNARWLGTSLAALLREAGVRAGADQILSRSADGMTLSTPIETIMDGRDALLAVGTGRDPLTGAGRRTAWAQHRGIAAVEWQVDDGPWRQAALAPVPGIDTWRQWVAEWDATPGSHTMRVRATDGTGATQPGKRVPPFPNGATGWHSIVVTVT